MKRNLQIILTATTASFLTFTVMAQDNSTLLSVHTENSGEIKRAMEIFTNAGAHGIGTMGEASAPDVPEATKDTDRVTRQDHAVLVAGN